MRWPGLGHEVERPIRLWAVRRWGHSSVRRRAGPVDRELADPSALDRRTREAALVARFLSASFWRRARAPRAADALAGRRDLPPLRRRPGSTTARTPMPVGTIDGLSGMGDRQDHGVLLPLHLALERHGLAGGERTRRPDPERPTVGAQLIGSGGQGAQADRAGRPARGRGALAGASPRRLRWATPQRAAASG